MDIPDSIFPKLIVEDNYLIPVIESGVIVFLGEKDNYGQVVVIEGEDGTTITYGNLKNNDLKLYDYIQKRAVWQSLFSCGF